MIDIIEASNKHINDTIGNIQLKASNFKTKNQSPELLQWQKDVLNNELKGVNIIKALLKYISELRAEIIDLDPKGIESSLLKNPKYQKYINTPEDYRNTVLNHISGAVEYYRKEIVPIKEKSPNRLLSDITYRSEILMHTNILINSVLSEIDKYNLINQQ